MSKYMCVYIYIYQTMWHAHCSENEGLRVCHGQTIELNAEQVSICWQYYKYGQILDTK